MTWTRPTIEVGDCWEWTGATVNGYGRVKVDGRVVSVHRQVWEELVGPLEPDQHIDHLCRNRICCNPDHLEPVSHGENMRRTEKGRCRKCGGTEFLHYKRSNGRHRRLCATCHRRRALDYARATRGNPTTTSSS